MHVYACKHMPTGTHTHIHIPAQTRTHIPAHALTHVHTMYICTYKHVHTHVHTHTPTSTLYPAIGDHSMKDAIHIRQLHIILSHSLLSSTQSNKVGTSLWTNILVKLEGKNQFPQDKLNNKTNLPQIAVFPQELHQY